MLVKKEVVVVNKNSKKISYKAMKSSKKLDSFFEEKKEEK